MRDLCLAYGPHASYPFYPISKVETKARFRELISLLSGSVTILVACFYSLFFKSYVDAEQLILWGIFLLSLLSWMLLPEDKTLRGKWCWADIALVVFCCYRIINIHHPFDISVVLQVLVIISLWILMRADGIRLKPVLIVGLALAATIQTIIVVVQKIGWVSSNHAYLNVTGSFGNSGPLGGFLVISIVMLWTLSFSQKKAFRTQIELKLLCCLIAVGVVLSGSRAAWLAAVIGMLSFHVWHLRKFRVIAIVACAFIFFVISAWLYLLRPTSADARLNIWKTCWNQSTHPHILGHGTASFPATYMSCQTKELEKCTEEIRRQADDVVAAFNETLQLYYENGLVGCVLFLIFLYFVAENQIKLMKRDDSRTGIFTLLAYLVFAQFSYPTSVPPLQVLLPVIVAGDIKGKHDYAFISGRLFVLTMKRVLLVSCILAILMRISINSHLNAYYHLRTDTALPDGTLSKWLVRHDSYLLDACMQAQMLVGDYEDALYSLNLLEGFVFTAKLQMDRARIYESLGKMDEAVRCYQLVQAMRPGLMEPLFAEFQILRMKSATQTQRLAIRLVNFKPKIRNSRTDAMKAEVLRYLQNLN